MVDNGPDARPVLPSGCPACDGEVEWSAVISWATYPDGGVYDVTCLRCDYEGQIDIR